MDKKHYTLQRSSSLKSLSAQARKQFSPDAGICLFFYSHFSSSRKNRRPSADLLEMLALFMLASKTYN